MTRPLLVFTFLLAAQVSAGQPARNLEKQLDIFWRTKHVRASAIANTVAFKAGDVVADIGTANGWFAALLSVFTDSVHFYLEDIDSAVWDPTSFDLALAHFASNESQPQANSYQYIRGTETSTGLPRNAFNKVLIIDTYHHFTQLDQMLMEVISLLRKDGKIIILEAIARRPGDHHQGCRSTLYSEKDIIVKMASQGMKLESAQLIHKVAGRKNKLFVFKKP